MTTPRPLLFRGKTQDLLTEIERDLRAQVDPRWQGQKDGAGQAMVKLFGRFADIIVTRLNQVPQQHFLAFLSEGGIDQLPSRAATTQLRFVPENDARPIIPIPAGTQVATRPAGQQLEVIFETTQDVQVIPTELTCCIAVDQLTDADQTRRANGVEAGSFAAFQGGALRERILYLRDDGLLTFPDQAVREHATVIMRFVLQDPKVSPAGKWQLSWFYWDGKAWVPLGDAGAQIDDRTQGFLHSGDVRLTHLPEIAPAEVNGIKGAWIVRQLAPLSEQATLPQILSIDIRREIDVPNQEVEPVVLTSTQAGVAFAQVKPEDPFYPFGQFPALLDGLYIRADEALAKPGATVELRFKGDGLPPKIEDTSALETLTVLWEYSSTEGWTPLGTSRWGCPAMAFADRSNPLVKDIVARPGTTSMLVEIELPQDYSSGEPPPGFPAGMLIRKIITGRLVFAMDLPATCTELPVQVVERGRSYASERLDFRDTTYAFTAPGTGSVAFKVPASTSDGPLFGRAEVNGQTGYWVRARIVEGAYSVPQSSPSGLLQKLLVARFHRRHPWRSPLSSANSRLAMPATSRRSRDPERYRRISARPTAGGATRSKTSRLSRSPGPWRRKLFTWASARSTQNRRMPGWHFRRILGSSSISAWKRPTTSALVSDLIWEYWNEKGWQGLDVVDETFGLWRSGTVGFFGPSHHQPSTDFFMPRFLHPCTGRT